MGNKPTFKFNDAAGRKLEAEIKKKLQAEADKAVQNVVRGVRDDMNKQPADKVYVELLKRMTKAGFQPDTANLREVAKEIEQGTLEG